MSIAKALKTINPWKARPFYAEFVSAKIYKTIYFCIQVVRRLTIVRKWG